ncbi:signal peptidase I [Flavobacterium sp. LHD-85]|uniref:signal peptidase I n=1 Tax=Flavobacterium sp. LHD-85 TaxID=3071410 RepID=UPI0027E0774C|nr:signal peptidase I [Flavobacterium sp. LHD-85]MDQ6527671.1 signal peptidase I [Flavobacterium sp. LHD-85]
MKNKFNILFSYLYMRKLNIKYLTIGIISLFFLLLNLYWLSLFLLVTSFLYCNIKQLIGFIKYSALKNIVVFFSIFLFVLFIGISIKLFTADIFKIPSSSMENMLYADDIILVNKLNYGPRLPRSPFEIPFINIAFYFNDTAKSHIKEDWWTYKRLSGTSKIERGDIFVFNSTWDKNFILVKRCISLPGDTITIKDAIIYTNRRLFCSPKTEKNNYKFTVKNKKALYRVMDSLALHDVLIKNYSHTFKQANLSKFELDHLKKNKCIDSITIQIDSFVKEKTFVKNDNIKWTFDNMGPFIIPKKGMQIKLNQETFSLYQNIINSSEGSKIITVNGRYFINNRKRLSYTFKQDYFFMMGDNRKETLDSRAWGVVPKSNIIGKVQCVLLSNYQTKFRWDRLFKNVK